MIEALVGIAVSSMFLMGFISLTLQSQMVARQNTKTLAATLALREAIEIARDLEKSDWDELTKAECESPDVCHPVTVASLWTLADNSELLDGTIERSLSWEQVCRNQAAYPNEIVEDPSCTAPNVIDPSTRKITATVSYETKNGTKTSSLSAYVYQLP